MKNYKIMSLVLAGFLFIGCSSKEPSIDMTKYSTEIESSEIIPIKENNSGMKVDLSKKEIIPPFKITPVPLKVSSSVEVIDSIPDSITEVVPAPEKGKNGLSKIYFSYDDFSIQEENIPALLENIKILNNKLIKIEGNCDEFGSDEYNFALGLKRAEAIKKFMIANGYNKNNISMVSYGESNPACIEKTNSCFSKNRRVEFVVP